MPLKIRPETSSDYPEITRVNTFAFGQPAEAKLVENLRKNPKFVPELSLVAEIGGEVVGHILFFPISIKPFSETAKTEETKETAVGKVLKTLSLAPVSVLPEYQKQGIGSALIKKGLKVARKLGFASVIVLGHPEYYPRFGFETAGKWGIKDPFGTPAEAFMALELKEGALEGAAGLVEYPEEFYGV